MFLLFRVLTNDCMNYSLEDIFLWYDTFHVLDKVIGLICLIVFQVVNDQVKSCFRNDVNKWWKDLKSIFSASEHNEVMSQKIVVLKDIA
jgi:hypothetical protein